MLAVMQLRALLRQPGRLVTGTLGVAVSVLIVILLTAMSQGVYTSAVQFPVRTAADLYVAQDGTTRLQSGSFLPGELTNTITRVGGVREVQPLVMNLAVLDLYGGKSPVYIVGYQPETRFGGPWHITAGQMVRQTGEVVVDQSLARQYNIKVGTNLDVLGHTFKVVGLSGESRSMLGATMFMAVSDAQAVLGLQGVVNFYMVRLQRQANANAVQQLIQDAMPAGLKVSLLDKQTAIDQTVDLVDQVMGGPLKMVTGVAYLIGIVLVGLLRYNSVMGRLSEFAALKAIGATQQQIILTDLLVETAVVLAFGLGAGLVLSWAAGLLVAALIPQLQVTINETLLLQSVASTLVIGLVSSVWPARRLKRIDPASAFH